MFSSKFLSGANPLNAVSSAVNKFGLFGDDGEGDKKSAPQQGAREPGEQQKGAGPGKDPQQQQGPQKSGQALPMQKTRPAPKQGSPQLQGNGQTGPSNKHAGPQATSKAGAQPDGQVRGEPPKNQPKGPPQQGSPKPGAQQQVLTKSGAQPGSPKAPPQQESPNPKRQQQGPANTGAQKQEPAKAVVQGSPKVGQQQQQRGAGASPQQQASDQRGSVQKGVKGPGAAGVAPAGSSSPGPTKAGPQSKTLCPVCKTTTLNVHTKEPPNHKTCTQCKTQVCSLCGFSPPDSDGREWLCLTCQIQRAQGTAETSGPPMTKPSPNKTAAPPNQTSSPAGPIKKGISAPGSPQKMQPTAAKVPAKGEVAKGQESQKQGSPAPVQKATPVTQMTSGSPKPTQTSQPGRKQSSATPAPQQESGGFFGFGSAKTEAAKPEETVTGKMFGFGSSIFSSASTLISSAGQDEPKTTPPVSPKIQSTKDVKPSPKLPRSEQQQQTKVPPAGPAKVEKSNCPICKMALNAGSKDPPNYRNCTECKCTVCNQCGFNPMPNVNEGKEWLCLNCQVKRAAGGAEPQRDPSLVNSMKKPMPTQPSAQKTSAPGSPQKKESTPATQPAKVTLVPGPQGSSKTGPQKQPDQSGQKQESGGFFGFGGPKTQPDASKPAESVTGKMFGFGSSFLSSASTLISSDESKATPPVSPKMSPAKDSKSPSVKRPEQEKKPEQPQQAKGPPSIVTKTDKPPSEPSKKPSALSVVSKPGQSTCPLCKLELNVGSKDPPNYNTCTECKNTVCNQCGFNPMPNVKEIKEWLCLNCQMQRALGAAEPPGTPLMKLQASPNKANVPAKKETPPQVKSIPTPAESKSKDPSPSGSPLRKPQKAPQAEPAAKTEAKQGPESQTQASPAPSQKAPQQDQKTVSPKPPDKTSQHGPKKGSVSSTQEESGGFFGFGGPKPQPEAAKPAESLGGKMFGFGSSLFSSASTLMTSAAQDESKTTPPVSPKMPAAKESKSPTVQLTEDKKIEQVQERKTLPSSQAKVEKGPPEPRKDAALKGAPATCPLCKIQLNVGSKDPPNYNKCTECKNTVCNQCGFNPMPNVSEVKEWLCLNCQMQRALSASELTAPPMKPQTAANKTSPTAAHQKAAAPNQGVILKKDLKSDDATKTDTPVPETLQKKGAATAASPQKTPPATKAAKGQESQAQASPGQKTPKDIQAAPAPQKPSDQASQLGQSKVTPSTQEPGKQPASTAPKPGPDAAKTTESIGGKMFGFGSSIFSSASTLISSAVQEESRTTPPGSRKMSAPPQVSPKMSAAPKVSPKTTPSVSPNMSPAREPKAQKPEQEKKSAEPQQSKEDKVQPQVPKAATASQMASPTPGQKPPVDARAASGPQKQSDQASQPGQNKVTSDTQESVKQPASAAPKPVPDAAKTTESIGGKMFGFGSSIFSSASTLISSAVQEESRTTPPGSGKMSAPAQVSPKMSVAPKVSPKPTPSVSPNMSPAKEAKIQKPEQEKKPDEPQQIKEDKAQPQVPKAATASQMASPTPGQKTPQDIQAAPAPQKPSDQASQLGQSKATPSKQEPGKQTASTAPKPGPDAAKTTESIGGKMFGFGSSIFSSASTLISSAVQEESRTTPPGSRKMSAPPQVSPKMSAAPKVSPKTTPSVSPNMSPAREPKAQKPEQEKKSAEPQQSKEEKAQPVAPKVAPVSQAAPIVEQTACPLCKVELNIKSKLPPNYNTCTECKTIVCNQCGFNPMPIGEVKEWLCLNCQMKRAVEAAGPPGPPMLKSQVSPKKVSTPAAVQLPDSSKPTTPQAKESPAVEKKTSEPILPQGKQTTPSVQSSKPEASTSPLKQASPKPDRSPQEKQKAAPEKQPDNANQPGPKPSNASAATQQESGGFFGFGSSKPQADAEKPTEKVTGKMFGFGSSIFSSASTLITSAVQDQPKTTPPVSPKLSPAKDSKPPAATKVEQDKKPGQPQQAKGPTSVQQKADAVKTPAPQKLEQEKKPQPPQQTKTPPSGQETVDKAPSASPSPSQAAVKPDQATCPLCKVKLNVGSKEQPNYNTCTECKNTVCNQCGFNPMPNETKVKEWLCLNCQMQRALGETQPPGVTSVTPQTKPQVRDPSPAEAGKKPSSAPHSPQRKASVTPQPAASEAVNKPAMQKQEPQKTEAPTKSPVQPRPTERKQSNAAAATQKDSGGFFGFGSGKTQPEAEKPPESVTGKMFGFGSSIFSSASTLISSTVQDQPKTTPPVSPKMAPAKEIKSPAAQAKGKPEQPQPTKTPPLVQAKVDKAPPEPSKAVGASQAPVKPSPSTCPLCKVELNKGSKDPPNYNMCTECKNTVCNQCGFNPMPNESEIKEWLCLTCQMQRALKASESIQPPLMKAQASPSKVLTTPPTDKDATANQKKDILSTQKDKAPPNIQDRPTPQKKIEVTPSEAAPTKDTSRATPAPTKEKGPPPPAKEVPISAAAPSKDKEAPQSAPAAPDTSTKVVSEKKEPKAEKVEKSVDQPGKPSDEVQPQEAVSKESQPVEAALSKTASPAAAEPSNQETGGFFGFGSPKSQRAASKATEAVTGKVRGFGSSLFSSASTLISSAVQEESVPSARKMSAPQVSGKISELQTSPKSSPPISPKKPVPSTRKMSAPQVAGRMSDLQVSPKSSPPVSPKKEKEKEAKPDAEQKPLPEKVTGQPEQAKAPPSAETTADKVVAPPEESKAPQAAPKAAQSTCPLCKVELNLDSKSPPNYNTCTECKATVCSKCGFSPMPNVSEVKEWLCLNCQMQRALGASEPPGLPMMKLQPSPSKEVPATTEKKETSVPTPQQNISKPDTPKKELVNAAVAKEPDLPAVRAATKKVAPVDVSLPDKLVDKTITKTEATPASPKPTVEKVKGQPGVPQQQVQASPKPAAPPDVAKEKPLAQQPPKAAAPPAKSVTPPVQPAKQESGGFFGFGAPKTPPTAAKSAESVTGKMFGFGSSFLSSASTLITSAVQDEPKDTPPTPRKLSVTPSVSPKTTPPVSPKMAPAKDTKPLITQKSEPPQQPKPTPPAQAKVDKVPSEPSKQPPPPKTQPTKDTQPPAAQKPEEKKAARPPQEKTPSTVDKTPAEPTKKPAETPAASKADESICPLCKIKLNLGSTDPANYNTCTECKTTVCNQCGFNPMPNETEVKEWLCLNCQVQRALRESEPAVPAAVKPQPSPSKVSTAPQPPLQEKPKEADVKKEVTKTALAKEESIKPKGPVPPVAQKVEAPQQKTVVSGTEQGKPQDVPGKQPVEKPPQAPVSQTAKTEVKPQQPSKSVAQPTKPAPPPSQPAKQESGGFFGFGAPKTPPTSAKSAESVKGKMFGFGSSFLSSASTLITSAVQDEPKSTPPSPRKLSTSGSVSPKITPPVSPKTQKPEPPQQVKPASPAPAKAEKAPPQLPKSTEAIQVAPKAALSTCPLCKVELNVGSKDPPNYNTCTECKNTVCNLCGFNPMPHLAEKEWLCLNCQTQRALSGQLGDPGKMPQPVSTKPETQVTPVSKKAEPKSAPEKAEPAAMATKTQPVAATVEAVPTVPTSKAKVEAASVKMEAVATAVSAQVDTTPKPTKAKVLPVEAGPQPSAATTAEPSIPTTVSMQKAEIIQEPEAPIKHVPKTEAMEKKEAKVDIGVKESPLPPESKTNIQQAEVAAIAPAASLPVTKVPVVPTSPTALEVGKAAAESKPEPGVLEKVMKDDKVTKPTQALQQDLVQPKPQEQQLVKEIKRAVPADSEELSEKPVGKITDISSIPESQPVSTRIKDQDENREELVKKRKVSLPIGQDIVTTTGPPARQEEDLEDQPQILPILQEPSDEQPSDALKTDPSKDPSMPVKTEVKADRRRLSFQAMEESSESELTATPSPKVQRRRLEVSKISSSSEDIKTESADSSIEDEDFIRKQIMGMGDEEEMSLSDDEKEKKIEKAEAVASVELDNASVTTKSQDNKGSTDNEDSPVRNVAIAKTDIVMTENVPETIPKTTFKKALPVLRQRQSTDEDVDSITESLSKGSSSVQASSFTPESAHTSASSLEEDSDSSPSHRKVSRDKQHRKGKHRQPTQPLPTIEDSSDEEKMRAHGQPLSPPGGASSPEDLREVTVIDESHRTSGSEYSASVESEPEIKRAVQRGRKPSPTVIPYIPSDPIREDTLTKPLKSAEEAYEEIIQKTKAIPGESPPDIEPLYGGMAIEDYLYESLVEEPDFKLIESQPEEPRKDSGSESTKKLRSPEEVYEEMMQKKRELMMIEHEFQQAQTAMESSSSGVAGPPSVPETCVVAMPLEETALVGQTDMPPTSTEGLAKKKKRPAPPRPSEPPKRTEGAPTVFTPTGSIGFVRPMVPQDPALRKALFPIPDLKITQCSSGEEEDDSLADEYGMGMSSDITPSDDSETKEDLSISPPLSETADMEPIAVICEIPEPKPIPTPISAPELTTTPSPVSPVSPPTSPATPDSSLASNATSSSSFQAQTPPSSDSTPMSTPTPPTSYKVPPSKEVSAPAAGATAPVASPTPPPVIVTIPDVVSDPSKAETPSAAQVRVSKAGAQTSPQVEVPTAVPCVVQMPDLVSSPSQEPVMPTPVIRVSAPSPAPTVVSAQPAVSVTAPTVSVTTSASATLPTCPGPVVVQMPDLVSTTAPISAQAPDQVSALVTTPAETQAKVVPSGPAVPSVSPEIIRAPVQTAQMIHPAPTSTTIVKKKVPPPPPPRSTSVSLPEPPPELPSEKTIQQTSQRQTAVAGQPMQSVVVDIQPRMEDMHSDASVPQVVTQTRQGHVVIIVPSGEKSRQTAQETVVTKAIGQTAAPPQISKTITHSPTEIQVASTPPLPPKPIADEIPAADTTPLPPPASPKPTAYAKPSVSSAVTTATDKVTAVPGTASSPSQNTKPPPPIPPKPISIPAGLVFSHKPGESVKPPPPHVAPKAATLPRTKQPPNALSLSITRPVESKLGTTSPKSPLSPRYAKCLQTYVVITLPSEPGSPTEAITVQAPLRRGSIPSTKVSGVRTTPSEQKTPTEAFSAQATVRRASVPTVRHPPPTAVTPTVIVQQAIPSEVVSAKGPTTIETLPSLAQQPLPVADVTTVASQQDTSIQLHTVPPPLKKPFVQQQQPMTQQVQPPLPVSEIIAVPTEPEIVIQPQTALATARPQPPSSVPQPSQVPTEVVTVYPEVPAEVLVPEAPMSTVPVQPGALTEVVTVPLQPEVSSDAPILQDIPAAVHSTVIHPQVPAEIEIVEKEYIQPYDVNDAMQSKSPIPEASPKIDAPDQLNIYETVMDSKEQAHAGLNNTLPELSSLTHIVQPSYSLPLETEQLSSYQPLVTETVTIPLDTFFPTEVITIDHMQPEVRPVFQLPYPQPAVVEVTPIPEIATRMTPSIAGPPLETQQMAYPNVPPAPYIQQDYRAIPSSVIYSMPPVEATALQPGFGTPMEIVTRDANERRTSITSSEMQPQAVVGIPVITSEATTSRRRTSISSIVQPPYTTSESCTYLADYKMPSQVVTTEEFATTRRESISMQQPLSLGQVVNMPAERDVPIDGYVVQDSYRRGSVPSTEQQPKVLTYSSEYDRPLEIITTEAYTRRTSIPTVQDIPQGVPVAPVTITQIQQESIESQEIRGPEKVVSSMSHMYSSSISTSGQPPESLPSRVTQVVTTEVQRTTVSVVHERLPQVPPPPSVAITIQPDIAKVQPIPKQNGKIIYPGDVIDLRTMKVGIKMTDQGMDLTPPESCRQSFSSDSSGRQITAVQPEIVNLSPEITPATTLSVVTDSITIVTCTATIASYKNPPAEKPLDLQGPVTSSPLPLTTYKQFEPLAQIVYRPVNTQPKVSALAPTAQDIPINLSFEALVSAERKQPMSPAPVISNGGPVLSLETTGAMDLSNYRPMRAMVALSGTSPGVVTTVVEDDGTPVDLTAGRRSVCCDVIYKLPFTGSCRTQPPVTNQPDSSYGYGDDHHQYDDARLGIDGIQASVSNTNLAEAGLFSSDPKNEYNYLSGPTDAAIDLTAAKLSAGNALDYTSKAAGAYPGMTTTTPYSQLAAAGFGVNSALRTSNGIVYSSVAAPVPSTYAITTQPGSILSTTITPTSTVQNQVLPHPYGFIPTTDPGQLIPFDTGIPKELLPTALADIITGYPEMYSDTTLEAIAASLDALASSPIFPGLDNAKMAQYQMEREFLELEKLKQLCLAEELEWERQEIQRYREQEQLMVQRELEELQALKQQLLLQQEEEHHAHMVAQQETYAQQKEQLQQIQHLQLQLQRQLDEHYGSTGTTGNLLDAKYAGVGDSGQYWPVKDESTTPGVGTHPEGGQDHLNLVNKLQADQDFGKKIIDSGVQTDDEDSAEKQNVGRRKKSRRNTDSSAQTDDEDQDEWDAPTKARRRSRKHSSEGKHGSKVSSIAIQTVAEISVQTDHSGTIKRPNVQMDTKVEIIKHISAPENSQRGGSLSCQTDSDRRHTPIEVGYSTHLTAEVPSKGKIFYTAVSPLSPEKSHGGQRMLTADPTRFSSGPRGLKPGQKSLSDPKSLSPSTDDRMSGYYADSYSGRGSPSGTGKKVKRTLPDPPPEDDALAGRAGYSTGSARRRLARSTTMARAKILQDIDKELDLVERESSKLRKKQAELDEEEKEIDAKLRYLEMGINRRKEALLKEREKRERAYLQGVAEERDYMSDSEVSNIREARGDGLERPRTAPQSEFDQFIPPQTEADSQYNTLTSPYSHYAQYVPQTQTTSHYSQQNLYQQQSLYHQQVSPYPTLSLSHGQTQSSSYQHALLLQQGKQRQTTLSDLEPKITTNYEVIRNQPLLIVPTSSESGYGVAHLGGKYGSLDLRLGLEERSMASSPMSSISADSFYADIDHHNARNYVLIEDIGELTKASTGLSNTGLGSGFNLPDKELSKADRLLRAAEVRRTAEVAEFLGSSRLQGYGKGEDDTMEEPYELKLLKQQIKQEFRRGTEGLEQLTGLGLPQYIHSDSSLRHFPKGEKYSIGRLTLEKQAAKQLPAAMIYQKQMKNKKALIDPKAVTKFSPIQESRDLEPEFGSYMGSGASSVSSLAARARLLQDEITFGLRKNLSEQQKYLGSSLGANLSGSLNLGQSLALGSSIRATAHDDGTYPSGTRSRPSSRPSSVYGLDLSIKRDLSSSSLRLKTEGDVLDAAFAPGVARAKPTSLPISQSRGRIPIVAQNSEEESPLSPVGQPMGMARASAGPLPPISADSRDQFGSSHSLPEVQQHMREESRTRGYDRDIAFIMDDLQGAMSDSEAGGPNWNIEAYHLRREDTDWFDKPREGHPQSGNMDRRQMKLVPYAFPHTHIKLKRDINDSSVSGNGLGIRVVGGKEIPGSRGEIGAYIAKVTPGGVAEQTGKVVEGMQVLEWNGVPLTGKTYEEVQCIMAQPCAEAEICVRLDLNMLSDPEHPQALEHHVQLKAGGQRSPGVDPKQLAAELQKVSQQQAPGMAGVGPGGLGVLSALERSTLLHSGTGSAASSGVPSPGQPASPAINKKQRHKTSEVMRTPHPITGEIQLQINYDRNLGNLIVHVLQARNLAPRDNDGYSDPFVKVYLLPGRGADNKRRTKYAQRTLNPEWNQTVIYKNIHLEQLKKKTLEVTVWDYDRSSSNDFLGEVLIDLSNTAQLDNTPRWLPLREQSESIEHSKAHHAAQGPPGSGQGHGQTHSLGQGYMSGLGQGQAPGLGDGNQDSPKNSVIKSRSHGIFPDPSKDMQMLPLEKSHSSPGSSKSSSDGQLRSHGPSRSQSKSSVTQAHLEDAGIAIAAAEAAVQQSRLQPRPGHRLGDVSGSVVLSAPSLVGDAYGDLEGEEGAGTGVDSAIFQVPRIGKTIPNGTDKNQLGGSDNEGGKTQVMGEIKVALKKEVKTEGDQLVLEILQCRNITYKFKSPDHLPDLYVKLYVVNVATQKRIIKKKTRVCRHDREPSFNETFRFPLNPTGHSIQLFLVSNGGKFVKKTLIGEAYIWLDKVDMRKRVVSWHKLFVSSTQTNP